MYIYIYKLEALIYINYYLKYLLDLSYYSLIFSYLKYNLKL